jgi:hypothetical protein
MSKRPSVIEGLDLGRGEAQPGKVVTLDPAAMPRPRGRPDVQHTSIYVPKPAYRKIREIALARDVKAHDLILEGIDLVLAKYGFPSITELKNGKA